MSNIIPINNIASIDFSSIQNRTAAQNNSRSIDEGHKISDAPQAASTGENNTLGLSELQHLTDAINKSIEENNQQLIFEVDKDTQSYIVKVIDKQTGDVIRQIPGEELINMRKSLKESMEKNESLIGILLDTKV
jgi:flagellar protein FlaG